MHPRKWARENSLPYDYGLSYLEKENGRKFRWTGEKAGVYIYLDQNGRNSNYRLVCAAPLSRMRDKKQTVDIYWRGRLYKKVVFRENNEYPLLIKDMKYREGFLEFRVRPGFNLERMNLGNESRILGVKLYGGDIPDIQVISPNGGENWPPGTVQDIRWDSTGKITAVQIEISFNRGRNYSMIGDAVVNNGQYSWYVDYKPSMNCLVRISNASGAVSRRAISLSPSLHPPSLTGFSFAPPRQWTTAHLGS